MMRYQKDEQTDHSFLQNTPEGRGKQRQARRIPIPATAAEEDDNDLVLDIPKTARSHPSEIPVGAGSFVIGIMVVSKRNILDVGRILSQQKKAILSQQKKIQYRHFGSFPPPGVRKGFVKR